MKQQNSFLENGDWIRLHYGMQNLKNVNITSNKVILKKPYFLLQTMFRIQAQNSKFVRYGQEFYLIHELSSKFLSHDQNQLYLTDAPMCLFTFEPVFQQQTQFDRKVKQSQLCKITSKNIFCLNYFLYVTFETIILSKNKATNFMITKTNFKNKTIKSLTNLWVYQLFNVQKETFLCVNQKKQLTNKKIGNEYYSYFTFQFKNTDNLIQQIYLRYEKQIVLKCLNHKLYLGFNEKLQPILQQNSMQNCVFIIQNYNQQQLHEGIQIKIKHKLSKLYLSAEGRLQNFKLESIFVFQKILLQQLRINFFINEIYKTLSMFQNKQIKKNEKQIYYKNKSNDSNDNKFLNQNLKQVLLQIISFIFGNFQQEKQFLQMNQPLKLVIDCNQQNLLKQAGLLKLIIQLSLKQSLFLSMLMMIISGICYKNYNNAKLFCCYFQKFIQKIHQIGVIECIFQIFANQQRHIQYLQTFSCLSDNMLDLQEKQKGITLQVRTNYFIKFLKQVQKRSFETKDKIKIVKLIQCLVNVKRNKIMLIHHRIALKALTKKLLTSIFVTIQINNQQQLMINGADFFQILDNIQKFQQELKLFQNQIHLFCSFYSKLNNSFLKFIRGYFPEKIILNSLKSKLNPKWRFLFLRILDQIYLTNQIVNISKNILQIQKDVTQKKNIHSVDFHLIQKIKHILLQNTFKSLKNQIIDDYLFMNIKVLGSMIKLNLISSIQIIELISVLASFLQKYSIKPFQNITRLIVQIINFFIIYEQINIYKEISCFFILFKQMRIQQNNYQIIQQTKKFIKKKNFFNSQKYNTNCFISLIEQSILQSNKQIFFVSSIYLKHILQRETRFIKFLKDVIFIQQKKQQNIYNKLFALKRSFINHILEYPNCQQNSLKQTIKQMIASFYQHNQQGQKIISSFIQNVFRQLKIIELIFGFINQFTQNLLLKNQLFPLLIQLMISFVDKNQTNIFIFCQHFYLIEHIFGAFQQTQSRLLHSIVQFKQARNLMAPKLLSCTLKILKRKQNKPYAVMTLLHLLHNSFLGQINKQTTLQVSEIFLFDSSYFPNVWTNDFQLNIQYCFISKLCFIILQNSPSNINKLIKKIFPLQLIFKIFLQKDILETFTIKTLSITILKKQLIPLIERLYQEQLFDIKLVSNFVKNMNQKLVFTFQKNKIQLTNFLQQKSDVSELFHCAFVILLKDENYNIKGKQYQSYFDQKKIILCDYYPLMCRMMQRLINPSIEGNKKQQSFQDVLHHFQKNIKKCLSKLSKQQYFLYQLDYNEGILFCEEILRVKFGFNLVPISEKKQYFYVQKKHPPFKNINIHNVFDSYVFNKNSLVLQILYSNQLALFLTQRKTKLIINTNFFQLTKMLQLIENENKDIIIQVFIFFAQSYFDYCKKTEYFFFIYWLVKKAQVLCQIHQNSTIKKQFLTLSNIFLQKFIDQQKIKKSFMSKKKQISQKMQIFQQKKKFNLLFKKKKITSLFFIEKIKQIIEEQIKIYKQYDIKKQSSFYCQFFLLSFQDQNNGSMIQIVLKWIRNKIFFQQKELSQYNKCQKYSDLIFETSNQHNQAQQFFQSEKQISCLLQYSINLLKEYLSFVKFFNCYFITKELYIKIHLCLQIIFQALTSGTKIYLQIILTKQIWQQINCILSFDDSWKVNIEQINMSPQQIFQNIISAQTNNKCCGLLTQVYNIIQQSVKLYGQKLIYQYKKFPLLPIKKMYGIIKKQAINILKQIKLQEPKELIYRQFFSKISHQTIDKNLQWIHEKHFNLFNRNSIASIYTNLQYQNTYWAQIANNMFIQNGVNLMSIKMMVDNRFFIEKKYKKIKIQSYNSRRPNYFQQIIIFLKDIVNIVISFYKRKKNFFTLTNNNLFIAFLTQQKQRINFFSIQKNKKDKKLQFIQTDQKPSQLLLVNFQQQNKNKIIEQFFLQKLYKVQIISDGQNYPVQFMIRPQCVPRPQEQKLFLKNISFVSVQLKLQSIIAATQFFSTIYEYQFTFFKKFHKFLTLTFLSRHIKIIQKMSPLLIIVLNLIILFNPQDKIKYFSVTNLSQPFQILALVNVIIATISFLIFCLKQLPIIILIEKNKQNRKQVFIKQILFHPNFLYKTIRIFFIFLVLYNKLFIALLSLDLLSQLQAIRKLIKTIWKAIFQILLAFILFLLIQYFFTILMYYYFKSELKQFCKHFGVCFGLVYITSFSFNSGFVEYLSLSVPNLTFTTSLQFFSDYYVLITYLIFFKLILIIVIDSFSHERKEKIQRQKNKSVACFICGFNRSLFKQSLKTTFTDHIIIDHNIWSYFYYYYCVNKKNLLQRSSFQRNLVEQIDIQWLPYDRIFLLK